MILPLTFTGAELEQTLAEMGVTHAVWLPDSALGPWEEALARSQRVRLVRICREGEAWQVAAGLWMGGARPLVMIQNTGLFESGDALRNAVFDLKVPIYAVIGYRSYLNANSTDSAKRFTDPILAAWGLETCMLSGDGALSQLRSHYEACREREQPGVALVPEGRM